MIKYKILAFNYTFQNIHIPRDVDENLKPLISHLSSIRRDYTINNYLNDNKGSVKDGMYLINTIYLYKEKEPNSGVILSVGDEISNNRHITIRKFIYNFNTGDIAIDINDSRYLKDEDIVTLNTLATFTKIKHRLSEKIELFKLDTEQSISTNTSKDLFDLKEIEEVLDTFLDKPEVKSALVEFKEYKDKKSNVELLKAVDSSYVLPEKFYFKLDTEEKVRWINQYKENNFYYSIDSRENVNRRIAYPHHDKEFNTNIHMFNINDMKNSSTLQEYQDVNDKFDEVLKEYPLKTVK